MSDRVIVGYVGDVRVGDEVIGYVAEMRPGQWNAFPVGGSFPYLGTFATPEDAVRRLLSERQQTLRGGILRRQSHIAQLQEEIGDLERQVTQLDEFSSVFEPLHWRNR